jgi:hypothetical protein
MRLAKTFKMKYKLYKIQTIEFITKACSQLVQRMFIRDIRFGFCPENHWLSSVKFAPIERLVSILETDSTLLSRIRFGQCSYIFQDGI